MSRVAIVQPSFVPWRGAFDLIDRVDDFVFLDNVQYTRRDWRNRNRVLMQDGREYWLTVPAKGSLDQTISEVTIDNSQNWGDAHLRKLKAAYGKSPGADLALGTLESAYQARPERLVDLTIPLTIEIAGLLGSRTRFHVASNMAVGEGKNERLIEIVSALGGTSYLSGPKAKDYLTPEIWNEAGITVEFISYIDYPPYPQISPEYVPNLSILDLLCMTGAEAPRYIWPDRYTMEAPGDGS